MANKQINELTEITSADSTDYLLVYDNDEPGSEKTKKIEVGNLSSGGWIYTDAVVTTSGTTVELTSSIPSSVVEIEVIFNEVSLDGNTSTMIQLGDSTGYYTTGYKTSNWVPSGQIEDTVGWAIPRNSVAVVGTRMDGSLTLSRWSSSEHKWIGQGQFYDVYLEGRHNLSVGSITLDNALTSIRLASRNESSEFDNGSARIRYR